MKIQIKQRKIDELFNEEAEDLPELLEEYGLKENKNNTVEQILKAMIDALSHHFSTKEITPVDNEFLDLVRTEKFLLPEKKEIPVEIVLFSNPNVASYYGSFVMGEEAPLGFHANTTGWELFRTEENHYNDKLQAFVCTDEGPLDDYISDTKDLSGDEFDFYKIHRCCADFLCTLTHELSHIIEFLENTGGMTPREAAQACEFLDMPFSVTKYGASPQPGRGRFAALSLDERDEDDFEEWEIHNQDVMEDRVEDAGRALFSEIYASSARLQSLIHRLTMEKEAIFLAPEKRKPTKSPGMST